MKSNLSLLLQRVWQAYGWKLLVLVSLISLTGFLEGSAIATLLPLLQLLGIGDFNQDSPINKGVEFALSFTNLQSSPLVVGVLTITLFTIQYFIFLIHSWFTARVNNAFITRLRLQLFQTILNAKWTFFLTHKQAEFTNAILSETERSGHAFDKCIQIFSTLLIISIYLSMAFFISWKITLTLLATGIMISVILLTLVKKGHQIGQGISHNNEVLHQCTAETLSGAKLIKATSAESLVSSFFSLTNEKVKYLMTWTTFYPNLVRGIVEILAIVSLVGTLIINRNFYHVDVAATILVLAIFLRIYPRLTLLQQSFQQLSIYLPSVNYVNNLETSALKVAETAKIDMPTKSLNNQNGLDIEIKDLSYQYTKDSIALNNISCHIPKGKIVAIIGGSGSGKTTLLDCLLGLLEPNKGHILINGTSLSHADINQWRNLIGYVAQDTILFNSSIAENIAWTKTNATKDDISHAAKQAHAHHFIMEKPSGYATLVGDRGSQLSGGQKQRIGIARALLGKPELLILDEATNALDVKTESEVMSTIESLRGKLTIVCVTHRLSTIKNADIIYRLDKGNLTEVSFSELNSLNFMASTS